MHPLVSVVIPAFNASRTIEAAVASCLRQTYPALEVIVVDDGSTDGTAELALAAFLHSHVRHSVVRTENFGQSSAINLGFNTSTGDYIKLLDADDILHDRCIAELMSPFSDHGHSTKLAVSVSSWVDFPSNFSGDLNSLPQHNVATQPVLTSFEWLQINLERQTDFMPGWLFLIPRDLFRVTLYNPRYTLNNDFDFSTRLLVSAHFVLNCPNAICFYRQNGGSLSRSVSLPALASLLEVHREGSRRLRAHFRSDSRMIRALNRRTATLFAFTLARTEAFTTDYEALLEEFGSGTQPIPKLEGLTRILRALFGWRSAIRLRRRLAPWIDFARKFIRPQRNLTS